MPKSPNQKLKLLYLMQILLEKTDELHPITVPEIISALSQLDVAAERKSIYDDLESLRTFGLDVVQVKSKKTGYYIGSRDFELPELKLLVDSVQSSKFITHKKTLALIKKIEGLASVYDAQLLQRQVYVKNRVKTMNESVYYIVDEIALAISQDKRLRFKYYDYTVTKERSYRRNGGIYEVSPFALIWDDENYYMLAFDSDANQLKHYRVDKMTETALSESARDGKALFEAIDMSSYSQEVFGMFTGEVQTVRLRFAAHLIGAVIDRFGKSAIVIPETDGRHFTISADVAVSPQFFAWLFGFGAEVEIVSPDNVRQQMNNQLSAVSALY